MDEYLINSLSVVFLKRGTWKDVSESRTSASLILEGIQRSYSFWNFFSIPVLPPQMKLLSHFCMTATNCISPSLSGLMQFFRVFCLFVGWWMVVG